MNDLLENKYGMTEMQIALSRLKISRTRKELWQNFGPAMRLAIVYDAKVFKQKKRYQINKMLKKR